MNNTLSEADEKAVIDILVEQLDVKADQVIPDAKIQEDLCADSLDVMEIIMAVEERFDVSVPDEKAERVSTVGDLQEAIAELKQKRG